VKVSPVRVEDLGLRPWQTTRVRIGVKPESANQGGFTLFGKGFGNYEQDLVMRFHYVMLGAEPASRKKPGES